MSGHSRRIDCDVLVVGGGINGAGIARNASGRGLRVLLCEKDDLVQHTSSASSKLIHGGLRYLEQLEFPLVHEALRERGLLLTRLAPHLVRPVPFLVPLTKWYERPYYGAGVALYDAMSAAGGYGRGLPWHRHLSRRGAHRLFPGLAEDTLRGAIRYFDGQVDDARYVLTLARSAASYGAAIATSTWASSGRRVVKRCGQRSMRSSRPPGRWTATWPSAVSTS